MDVARTRTKPVAIAAAIDGMAVMVFAVIGRVSHDEGPLGVFATAWPFLVGLAVGWGVMRAWRHPQRIIWTGIGVWVATVAGGMLLRLATGQGTQLAFILVAAVSLGILLIGWRGLGWLIARSRRRHSAYVR